jgi:exosortase
MARSSDRTLVNFPLGHLLLVIVAIGAAYATIIPAMVMDWYHDENYSHGFLVPLISGYFLYARWPELKRVRLQPSNAGLVVILVSLLLLVLGFVGREFFTMRVSLVVLLAGLILFWCGRDLLRLTALPVGFLLFMVPIPYIVYDAMAFPLKLLVAEYSVLALKVMGITVLREGNIIMFPQTVLEVADACSGLRSLMSLLTLAVAVAFVFQKSMVKRLVLIVSALPIAIVTNMFRVIATGVLAQYYGAAAAKGFFHEFAGLAVFVLAMALLLLESALLRRWHR